MELILYVLFLVTPLGIMLVGMKYNPFICILGGFAALLGTVYLINDNVLKDSLSGFSTTAFPAAWISIVIMITSFLLPFERLGTENKRRRRKH